MISKKINKKLLILALSIVFLMIIPASFASDDGLTNQNLELSIDDEAIDVVFKSGAVDNSNQIYVDADNGNINGTGGKDNPVKTISQGLNLVNDGGSIYMTGIFSGEGNSNLVFDAAPNNIAFIGQGTAIIDGNYSTSFANVNQGTYSFKNITFINHFKAGEEEELGGVFHNEKGKLTFEECIFENNTVYGVNRANGGAIDSSGTLIIKRCIFYNNTAYVTNSSGYRKNAADGGAVSNLGKLFIYDSEFRNNKALRNGGAIRTQDGAENYIENCEFIGNVAAYHLSGGSFGGAVYTWDCGLNLINSKFENNRVYDLSGYGAQGGAISSDRGSGIININSCQFINNTADGTRTVSGQSIYIGGVTANINYCTIDTGIYSISQSSDFNKNWWVVNDTNINKLIENLPPSASVKTFAEAKISSNVEVPEIGKTVQIFVNLYWNGTENQENIHLIPTRTAHLQSNCGNLDPGEGNLTKGSFASNLKITSDENPLITANIDNVIVEFDFTQDNNTKIMAKSSEISEGQTAIINIYSNRDIEGICLIDIAAGKYYAELVKGKVNASIPNLKAGTYDVYVKYLGNETLYAKTNLTVKNKQNAIIVVNPSYTCPATDINAGEKGRSITLKLKDGEDNNLINKTLQVALNCKVYNLTTDEFGCAKLDINLQTAKEYACAISFNGDEIYNASPLTITKITVSKKKTVISASAKTFTAKAKSKTISVTLKTVKNQYDGKIYLYKGKKLTLTVNGKTYTAKTNSKGVAKFSIKLTKKGKYNAKIKFAGDATYKTSTKSIQITIKWELISHIFFFKFIKITILLITIIHPKKL